MEHLGRSVRTFQEGLTERRLSVWEKPSMAVHTQRYEESSHCFSLSERIYPCLLLLPPADSSFGFQCGPKTSIFPGIFQAFCAKLGLLRHLLASRTEPLQCSVVRSHCWTTQPLSGQSPEQSPFIIHIHSMALLPSRTLPNTQSMTGVLLQQQKASAALN